MESYSSQAPYCTARAARGFQIVTICVVTLRSIISSWASCCCWFCFRGSSSVTRVVHQHYRNRKKEKKQKNLLGFSAAQQFKSSPSPHGTCSFFCFHCWTRFECPKQVRRLLLLLPFFAFSSFYQPLLCAVVFGVVVVVILCGHLDLLSFKLGRCFFLLLVCISSSIHHHQKERTSSSSHTVYTQSLKRRHFGVSQVHSFMGLSCFFFSSLLFFTPETPQWQVTLLFFFFFTSAPFLASIITSRGLCICLFWLLLLLLQPLPTVDGRLCVKVFFYDGFRKHTFRSPSVIHCCQPTNTARDNALDDSNLKTHFSN